MHLTLTNRLRLAALARADRGGRVVGTYVIDEDGVIDLRALEDRAPASRASDLASLGDIAGRFGDAGDISGLYEESEPQGRRWFTWHKTDSPGGKLTGADQSRPAGPADFDVLPPLEPDAATEPAGTDPVVVLDDAADAPAERPIEEPPSRESELPAVDTSPSNEADLIDLRDQAELTSLQQAIQEFNAQAARPRPEAVADGRRPLFGPAESPEPVDDEQPAPAVSSDINACPVCGGPAIRDFTNRFLEIDFYSCGDCFHMWHDAADSGGI